MGWIGLHIGEEIDPHCTLAWWDKDNKTRDTLARQLHKSPRLPAIAFVPGVCAERMLFGRNRDHPVVLLRTGTATLTLVRRLVQALDQRVAWRPHVSLLNGNEPPEDGIYLFTCLGVHTFADDGTKRHEYYKFKK